MKTKTWKILAVIGSLIAGWGIHQLFIIPTFPADHWDWLIPTPELIEYIKSRFQNMGLFALANGLFILWTAWTGLKNGQRWAWWTLLSVPLYLLLLTAMFYWLAIFTIPLALLAAWALWVGRNELKPVVSSRGRLGWILVFVIGLLLLYFAYDNIVVIPSLDVRDPDRGWSWLTTDPAHMDYIKLYFRVYGIHVLTFAGMVLLATWLGLREGNSSARHVLWLTPALIVIHVLFWPWVAPLLIAIALLAAGGVYWAVPRTR